VGRANHTRARVRNFEETRREGSCSIALPISIEIPLLKDKFRLESNTVHTFHSEICRRLRVVSNFGDRLWGGRNTHARACEISRRRDVRGAPKIRFFGAPLPSRRLEISRARVYFARVCVFRPPQIAIAKIRDYSQSRYAVMTLSNFL